MRDDVRERDERVHERVGGDDLRGSSDRPIALRRVRDGVCDRSGVYERRVRVSKWPDGVRQ